MAEEKEQKELKKQEEISKPEELAEKIISQQNEEKKARPPSAIFMLLSNIMFALLLAMLGITSILTLFAVDFLDIYTFRYKIPENYRKSWPLSAYYDFVQRHQLPEEQKYHEMMLDMQSDLSNKLFQTNIDLEERSKQLEKSYTALVKTQKDIHTNDMVKLQKKRDEFEIEKKKLDEEKADFEKKRAKNEELANRLASETANVESSLIRFMENQNRLDQICSIAAQMDTKALAKIFDELPDDRLIYNIMGGLQPSHSGKVLGEMDAEKASKVMRIGNLPITLPEPNVSPSYVPPSLQALLDETRLNSQ